MALNFTDKNQTQDEIANLRERLRQLEQQANQRESNQPAIEQQQRVEMQPRVEQDLPSMVNPFQNMQPPPMSQALPSDDQFIGTAPVDTDILANQIKFLVKIALTDGLEKSIDMAIKMNNAYVLNELHDTLVDHLYEQLLRMKKIEAD